MMTKKSLFHELFVEIVDWNGRALQKQRARVKAEVAPYRNLTKHSPYAWDSIGQICLKFYKGGSYLSFH